MLDHLHGSHQIPDIANKHIEKAVFWGMLIACVVVAIGMLKGVLSW